MLLHVSVMADMLFSVLCMPHPVRGCNNALSHFHSLHTSRGVCCWMVLPVVLRTGPLLG